MTLPQLHIKNAEKFSSDKAAIAFIVLAMSYLLCGLLFGVLGGFQYLLPPLLKDQLAFEKVRPLHVYLVISWIFTAAQGCIYYFIPRIAGRELTWKNGITVHLFIQLFVSAGIIVSFFLGYFSGREYLEFPPWMGIVIILSWIPLAWNFFITIKPKYGSVPVYIWSFSAGIVFFFITMVESYLWLLEYFNENVVRDVTVQWKAMGGMVGSWNMLVYGSAMYVMEKIIKDTSFAKSKMAFAFFFLGFANLLFNWGHHTYIVPAAPWVKTVAYVISMTELLILGNIILKWRKTLTNAQKNRHNLPFRFLTFADGWIFVNLTLAIAISVPALNYYTHGTHITVAHAMGATIGINTMLLFGCIFYILKLQKGAVVEFYRRKIARTLLVTNIALVFFWVSLLGSGLIKIAGKLNSESFQKIMENSRPLFQLFTVSGVILMAGIILLIFNALKIIQRKVQRLISMPQVKEPDTQALLSQEPDKT